MALYEQNDVWGIMELPQHLKCLRANEYERNERWRWKIKKLEAELVTMDFQEDREC